MPKHLLDKAASMAQLNRWVILLQEFALEIPDKKGTENMLADHISRLPTSIQNEGGCDFPIHDSFPADHLFALAISSVPWLSNLVNYLAFRIVLPDMNSN